MRSLNSLISRTSLRCVGCFASGRVSRRLLTPPDTPTMTTDVEMKSESDAEAKTEGEAPDAKRDSDAVAVQELREHARQIDKAIANKEPRFALRVLRCLPNTRRKLNAKVLRGAVAHLYPSGAERDALLAYVEEAPVPPGSANAKATKPPAPEVDAYVHLLALLRLIDLKRLDEAETCSEALAEKVAAQNRRTLDIIAAKCYFYRSRVAELRDDLVGVRAFLHARLRTATLRNDSDGQAVLINCLLRNYLHYNLYDQADKLVGKSAFPEAAPNNEWARYLYYLGRVKAARLEYSDAHKHLVQAIRKAPQHAAVGFRQHAQKLAVLVELLLGDIPDRKVFRQACMRRALAPYFHLTRAVRAGNLQRFGEVLENFDGRFRADKTRSLILRLRHNVIKTAIRSIGLSYSRISSRDIARRLGLDSTEDAEFFVAKAIKDGVVEATVDPETGDVGGREASDVYCTREPQLAFHRRIAFCLELHKQSVKAMRYPPKSYGKELESAEERREREQQDLELAKEMAEEDDDGFP